jgi:hypothetical protein
MLLISRPATVHIYMWLLRAFCDPNFTLLQNLYSSYSRKHYTGFRILFATLAP